MEEPNRDERNRGIGGALMLLKVALAWLPFFVVWGLFLMVYGDATVSEAAFFSLVDMGTAALLGGAVWWLSGRYPWPEQLRVSFYLTHLLVGSVYATTWMFVQYAVGAARENASLVAIIRESRVLGWQFLMGLTLYAMIAGVSYSVRTRRRLRDQERVVARAEALAMQAQLQTLRAQLNPHFLFNALHSLSVLIAEDPTAAELAVDRLGEMLRYALDEGLDGEVLLSDEWAFTRHYLDLEALRFNSRLRVESRFEPGTLSKPVPPFTLQPLVENAVRHGIAPRPEGGRVTVLARLDGDFLRIVVRDDGPGAAPSESERSRGYGLGLLRRRLEAIYAGAAGLEVRTAPGEGFEVEVRLPGEGP